MKRTTFFALCLGLFIFSCEKKVIAPKSVTAQPSSIDNQSPVLNPGIKPPASGVIKSVSFPTFDLNNPVVSYDTRNAMYVTSYFETGYSDTDTDYWLQHEFAFENHTVKMMYHYIIEDNRTLSEVYSSEGNYQFTYIDVNGLVTVEQDGSLDPAEMYDGFLDCLKYHLFYNNPDWVLVVGAPAITYYAYRCYKECR